jgi:hypothetical protein
MRELEEALGGTRYKRSIKVDQICKLIFVGSAKCCFCDIIALNHNNQVKLAKPNKYDVVFFRSVSSIVFRGLPKCGHPQQCPFFPRGSLKASYFKLF